MRVKGPARNAAAIIDHGNLVGVAIIFEAGLDASGNLALPGSVKRRAQAAAIIDRRIAAQAILAQLLAGLQLSASTIPQRGNGVTVGIDAQRHIAPAVIAGKCDAGQGGSLHRRNRAVRAVLSQQYLPVHAIPRHERGEDFGGLARLGDGGELGSGDTDGIAVAVKFCGGGIAQRIGSQNWTIGTVVGGGSNRGIVCGTGDAPASAIKDRAG